MRWRERVWRWVTRSAEVYMAGLPRKAFINSLSNCLREYPQLNGRESVVVHRIEELYQSGMERHAALAVDDRASTHLQIACLVQGTYQTLLPWFKNDHEKVMEIIRKPVGESSAAAVGVAQRIALLLSFDKFRLVSKGLKHMEADFGKAFVVEHYEKPDFHRARVRRCLYHSVFTAEGNPQLTPIFCALDSMWFDQLKPQKHGVEFRRPTTLAGGNAACDFVLRKLRGGIAQHKNR
ncbi:uncharacterized protein [Physcomitrium patens]|uniref:L-2-amino-thiazoline-4-carboxylic acid hydrolase n=3 Tax=Physcomitrium patens TaxID=3218 RepID=A0A2K1KW50_PHYPA|nr:uncharacterized protein LOC112280214 [Physcomitrium patens]PNR57976.1 hypothetical protein PHYPA_004970 [Physcomitrium patens]|eukprot:XP_024371208.1 uncharacterized protein LOC112280214 [Physcomitrella patens]